MSPRLTCPPDKTTIQTIWTRGFHILMLIARTITRRRSERTGHVSMLRHSRSRRPQTCTSSSRFLPVRARRPSSCMRIRALSNSSQRSISKARRHRHRRQNIRKQRRLISTTIIIQQRTHTLTCKRRPLSDGIQPASRRSRWRAPCIHFQRHSVLSRCCPPTYPTQRSTFPTRSCGPTTAVRRSCPSSCSSVQAMARRAGRSRRCTRMC